MCVSNKKYALELVKSRRLRTSDLQGSPLATDYAMVVNGASGYGQPSRPQGSVCCNDHGNPCQHLVRVLPLLLVFAC